MRPKPSYDSIDAGNVKQLPTILGDHLTTDNFGSLGKLSLPTVGGDRIAISMRQSVLKAPSAPSRSDYKCAVAARKLADRVSTRFYASLPAQSTQECEAHGAGGQRGSCRLRARLAVGAARRCWSDEGSDRRA